MVPLYPIQSRVHFTNMINAAQENQEIRGTSSSLEVSPVSMIDVQDDEHRAQSMVCPDMSEVGHAYHRPKLGVSVATLMVFLFPRLFRHA
jgi:hypothetical protein